MKYAGIKDYSVYCIRVFVALAQLMYMWVLFSVRCLYECQAGVKQESESFDWLQWEFSRLKVIYFVLPM